MHDEAIISPQEVTRQIAFKQQQGLCLREQLDVQEQVATLEQYLVGLLHELMPLACFFSTLSSSCLQGCPLGSSLGLLGSLPLLCFCRLHLKQEYMPNGIILPRKYELYIKHSWSGIMRMQGVLPMQSPCLEGQFTIRTCTQLHTRLLFFV